jgi:ABC-type transport system substrate-binding protein
LLNGSRDRAAWALLSADDPLYPAVKDGLRQFTYDVTRARALLADVGWTVAGDGSLRHAGDGRRFRTAIWGTPGRDQEMTVYASYWRALGAEVEEYMTPPARYRDREFRAQFPGWDYTGTNLTKMMADVAAGPANNWTGNTNGYEDPRARRLVDALETTIVEREQLQGMKAINDFVVAELPALPIFFLVQYTAAHKIVQAFDDMDGSDGSERVYGGYARNAYLWNLQ